MTEQADMPSGGTALIVGLTGGIAAGKSTVAGMFAELGAAVVDADQIAREVVEPGSDALARVVAEFGEGVLDSQGRIDRAALAERVFSDTSARRRLEAIMHPAIGAASVARFAELAAAGHRVVIYEASLLVETGRHRQFPLLVVVIADDRVRVQRVISRDGLTPEQARARLAAQLPQQRKAELADYVIDNSGDEEQTRTQVRRVFAAIAARAQ